jgi:hypothetical protein
MVGSELGIAGFIDFPSTINSWLAGDICGRRRGEELKCVTV